MFNSMPDMRMRLDYWLRNDGHEVMAYESDVGWIMYGHVMCMSGFTVWLNDDTSYRTFDGLEEALITAIMA